MASNLRLEGKIAIVTGGASGIDEATVRLFASHGATIVITDVQDSIGLSVVSSISPPGRCTYVHCNVHDELQVIAAVNHAVQTHSRLDIMFSNVRILGQMTSILNLDMSDFDNILVINIRGMVAAIKHVGRAMVSVGINESIICTASVAAVQGGLGLVAYTAAKTTVLGLMKVTTGDLGAKGVRVNCVSPFGVATPLACEGSRKTAGELEELMCEAAPLKGPMLRALDIVVVVLFLASDDSAFISGQNIIVDGAVTTFNDSIRKFILN